MRRLNLSFSCGSKLATPFQIAPVPPRYRSPYFSHMMGDYSAGYYAYIWSEVLDANTVEWLKAEGGLRRANGDRLRRGLLSRGGSEDAWLRGVAKLLRQLGGLVDARREALAGGAGSDAARAGVHHSDLAFVAQAELRAGANAH